MSDWAWLLAYDKGRASVVLADRDTIGVVCETLGGTLLNSSNRGWLWWVGLWPRGSINLGTAFYRGGCALLDVAERHTRHLAEIPVDGDLLYALKRHGLIDDDEAAPQGAGS